MALKGTLKDFGIADILQLIGQQQKTGVLWVKSKPEEVSVSFREGLVVRALSKTRQSRELLGTMLVNSGMLQESELEAALEIQKRTLKRLGDVLVSEGKVSAEQLRQMAQLQTTETVYRLFGWHAGTYEFVQQDVELDPAQGAPLRPESMLMEGFRRIDEWPMVRRRITSMALTFERAKPLDPAGANDSGDDAALDALGGPKSFSGTSKGIGNNERILYRIAEPEFTVQRLCEISRLGEFETCKALFNLMEAGYLTAGPIRPDEVKSTSKTGRQRLGERSGEIRRILQGQLAQLSVGVFLFLSFVAAARALGNKPQTSVTQISTETSGVRRLYIDTQTMRIMSALDLYRLAHGKYPDSLSDLVADKLLAEEEVKFPFQSQYHYRTARESYVLLPPLE
jgi:hypothetical protein